MNQGFFGTSEFKTIRKQQHKTQKRNMCHMCSLGADCISPKMEATGEGNKGILIISEAPTKVDDARGKPLTGAPGKFLSE